MHSLDHLLSDRRLTAALLLCSSAQAESLIEMVKSNAAGRLVLTLGGMDQAHWTARYVFPACFMACFAVCSTNLYTKQTPVRRPRPLWTLAPAIPNMCLAPCGPSHLRFVTCALRFLRQYHNLPIELLTAYIHVPTMQARATPHASPHTPCLGPSQLRRRRINSALSRAGHPACA